MGKESDTQAGQCIRNTTHVTQETDQSCGPFKTPFLVNLDQIVDSRLTAKVNLSCQPKFVGLPLFGGVNHDTKQMHKGMVAIFM